jgi:hypothetical protein
MKQFIRKSKLKASFIALLLTSVAITSFQDTPIVNQVLNEQNENTETSMPSAGQTTGLTMKAFDRMLDAIHHSLSEVQESSCYLNLPLIEEQAMKALDQVNMDRVLHQLSTSVEKMDMEKMLRNVENSLRQSEAEKFLKDVEISIHYSNNKDLDKSFKSCLKEAREEMEKAKLELSSLDKEAIKNDMRKARAEIERSRAEWQKSLASVKNSDLKKIMSVANLDIEKLARELELTRELFSELQKDGLVDFQKGFQLEYKEKSMYIDGKKQSDTVSEKFSRYIKGDRFEMRILGE